MPLKGKNAVVVYKLAHILMEAIYMYSVCNYLMFSVLSLDNEQNAIDHL